MRKNVTLSAEADLLAQARGRAQQEKTTLNAVFSEWLERYVGREAAADRYLDLMRKLSHISAGKRFSRDEMNDR